MAATRELLPIEVKQAIAWSVPRGGDRFVVALPSPIPKPVAIALLGMGCIPLQKAAISEGSALLLRVPSVLVPAFRALPSGGRGSLHPSNHLGF